MPHSIPKDPRDANAPAADTRDMVAVFIEHLRGADRVVVETENALGEIDAHYMHAPAILKAWVVAWNIRALVGHSDTENARLRAALRWVEESSGCQASRGIAAAALKGTDT